MIIKLFLRYSTQNKVFLLFKKNAEGPLRPIFSLHQEYFHRLQAILYDVKKHWYQLITEINAWEPLQVTQPACWSRDNDLTSGALQGTFDHSSEGVCAYHVLLHTSRLATLMTRGTAPLMSIYINEQDSQKHRDGGMFSGM
jgi:hypothetical protein